MLPKSVEKYLSSRAVQGPWTLEGTCHKGFFEGVVVIPALAESANLFSTLRSLTRNPPEFLDRFLVMVVVNNREDALPSDKADNEKTLQTLAKGDPALAPLSLAWIDAASPGRELPLKKGGVGLARKLGFDQALPLLDFTSKRPILVALDADTLTRPDYLPAITEHFRSSPAGGAVLPFRHQECKDAEKRKAILRYELFLRAYVLGLSRAGSPYAFHTVGSAMACTARAYVEMGGMNTRQAAEDFYFLQHLKKTADVAEVRGTVVYPSGRSSHRVPFGTGKSVSRLLDGEENAVLFHGYKCFAVLKEWLSLVERRLDTQGNDIRQEAEEISPGLAEYLDRAGFVETWEKLRANSRDETALLTAFHSWFDGLRTMKLVHHLSDTLFLRKGPEETLPSLLKWAGIEPIGTPEKQLELLRTLQSPGQG